MQAEQIEPFTLGPVFETWRIFGDAIAWGARGSTSITLKSFIALIVLVHESKIQLPQHMDESCNTNYILNTQARWYSLRLLMKKEDVYLQTWGRKEYIYKQREPIKSIKGKNFVPRCISRRYPARSINSEPAPAFVRKRDLLTNVPHLIPIISF